MGFVSWAAREVNLDWSLCGSLNFDPPKTVVSSDLRDLMEKILA